jgi:hypothetical protein
MYVLKLRKITAKEIKKTIANELRKRKPGL